MQAIFGLSCQSTDWVICSCDMARAFEKSHPWINFNIDLRSAQAPMWMNLGEARSKCEHIAGVPLRPDTAQALQQIYLAKGVLATAAIEGNTLTEDEVKLHLEGKLKLPPSKEYLQQEIDNIISACNDISLKLLQGGDIPLNLKTIQDFDKRVLAGLEVDPDVVPGEIRKMSVGVGTYLAPPFEDCQHLLEKLCEWLDSDTFEPPKGDEVVYALIKAIVAHIYIAWIHPFGDGNGRTARLIEFKILLEAGAPYPAAHLLSNFYNQTRQEYYRQLDKASKSGGNILPFLAYAIQGFVDGLKEQLNLIRNQQWDVAWRNYIHETFRDNDGSSAKRQRRLALDLGQNGTRVPLAKLQELTPAIAKLYATKTIRTVQRDLNHLDKLGIIERTSSGVRARREKILAFLPPQCDTTKKSLLTPT